MAMAPRQIALLVGISFVVVIALPALVGGGSAP